MSLSIQNDAGGEGGGDTVDPMTVQVNLGTITDDLNIGQGTTTGDLIQVTYSGPGGTAPAMQISTIVNSNFGVNPGAPDIIILGVGPNFTALDGSMLCGNGFTAAPMTTDNPTGSIYVVYDTTNGNGGGIFVRAPGGAAGTFTSPTPGAVVLYHELSHAHRAATGTQQVDDEIPAINDENVLRPLLHPPVPLRDPNPPHDGSAPSCGGPPGTGGCCIVASISTGSAYSAEVNELRAIRDGVLRLSDIGYDFFDRLHYDYYAFSPEVCRMMARSNALQEHIRLFFVGPLARVLKLAHLHNSEGYGPEDLGRAFEEGVLSSELATLESGDLEQAMAVLKALRDDEAPVTATDLLPFADSLRSVIRITPLLRWALLEPVEIYSRALESRLNAVSALQIGRQLARELDAWAAAMPLTDVWETLTPLGLLRELQFLGRVLVRNRPARVRLGARLAARFADDGDHAGVLRATGFLPDTEV